MINFNIKKNKRILILFSIIITISFLNVGYFIGIFNNSSNNSNLPNEFDFFNELKTSDYSSSSGGIGENMNISLHQSYLNISFNTALSPSDPKNNSFTLPCPTDVTFNTSYTEIMIKDIFAPNRTLDLEKDIDDTPTAYGTPTYAYSFPVPSKSTMKEFEICLSGNSGSANAGVGFQIWNATWTGGLIEPGTNTGLLSHTETVLTTDNKVWHKISVNAILDPTNTDNSTFFIVMWNTNLPTSYPEFNAKTDGDGPVKSLVYYTPIGPWVSRSYEVCSNVTLELLDNTPKPTELNIKINDTNVNDIDSSNSGKWISNEIFSNPSGQLKFNITADWWDVTCNVSQVLINYTKTDLGANSKFNIAGSGQTVEWNVTRNGGLNYFDTDFNNYRINFTIPATWHDSSIKVFNSTDEWTIKKRLLGNGYRDVEVLNARNGTFWFLNATSTNLLSIIDTYLGITPTTLYNFSQIAHFNATFSKDIIDNDGIINLSVYSPVLINNDLNYSIETGSFTGGSEISIIDWDISDNVTQYGDFRVQVFWYNNTAAGFLEKTIKIFGETDVSLTLPSSPYDSSRIFDIEVYFDDAGLTQGIEGATITYQIESGPIRTVLDGSISEEGNGYYNITIDCNHTDFNGYGPKSIEINASKIYYNNQSVEIDITIYGETALVPLIPRYSFNSTESFDIALFYNDTIKDLGIDGATIEVIINQTLYSPVINPLGGGDYNITINCDHDIFDNLDYGDCNITINIDKSYYYNHSVTYIIHITGETSLSATKFPDPSIGYYNSDETFNITVYFEDNGRTEGISGGDARIFVKRTDETIYEEYLISEVEYGVGNYNFTIYCSDNIFYPYGKYDIKINITKTNYYAAQDIILGVVIGNTTLTILDPTGTVSYVEDETFDISVFYEDHTRPGGIINANITYSIEGNSYRSDNILPDGPGIYNITINANDAEFGSNYKYVDILIRANKSNYINLTRTFTFERQILTQITPSNTPAQIQVIRGVNATYTFNYLDILTNPIVKFTTFENITSLGDYKVNIKNNGGGSYTLDVLTANVLVTGTPDVINFSIYAFGNQSQEISLTILVTIIQTRIESISWNDAADFARSTRIDISIDFYFNDTTNILPISGLQKSDVNITNNGTGTYWGFNNYELFTQPGPGNYKLNISTIGKDSGYYTLQLQISKVPNYNWSLTYIQFYLRGNYTQIDLVSMSHPGGLLTPKGANYNYTIFEGSDINMEFNLTDLEFGNALVLGDANSYSVWYENLGTGDNGTLLNTLHFVYQTPLLGSHIGTISTSNTALTPGNYLINITITKTNYESTYFVFNLTVIEKYQIRLDFTYPDEVNAGDPFDIIIIAEYYNGTGWFPIADTDVDLTPYFNDIASSIQTLATNVSGGVLFTINVLGNTRTMNLTIELREEYYHVGEIRIISDITVIPLPTGFNFKDILPYLIIAGIAVAAIGASVGIYRGVIVPKKREKTRILTEVKTIFDDAINLEHILVLYKGTGTCVYFKSFGSEEIDPELISGFISAISSFGKDLVSQEELNEISYGDKMLLLSDGEHIRVALVLGKQASLILRRNLMEFIHVFEKSYSNELPNWRGQLNIFHDAGILVDDVLNTSIILPHEISYEISTAKTLKKPQSKDVLKIANNLTKETERNFFFIATLLKEASEKTGKETAEIFMGIKELRDKKILMPIEIAAIETPPISQQEVNLINQKVSGLVNLSPEERQKLVNDLSQMGPAEREAYFVSLSEHHEIVSAPIETTVAVAEIENVKEAKKEIKKLKNEASKARKEKEYDTSIKILHNAVKIATRWELSNESQLLDDLIRLTKIEDLNNKLKTLEKEAKLAAKGKNYNEAAQKYKVSSKIASEIFKLGVTEMTKEVKRLTNKAKEFEKLI